MLEKLFGLSAAKTTVKTEVMAGLATFLTMAYITVVNPAILSTEGSGMGFGAVFTATIIAAVIGTLIMGLWANWPVALAPGMGLNAFLRPIIARNKPIPAPTPSFILLGILLMIYLRAGVTLKAINTRPATNTAASAC